MFRRDEPVVAGRRWLRPAAGVAMSAALVALGVVSGAEKLKPADLVARHLDAIGPAEAREALTTYRFTGTVEALIRMAGTVIGSGTNRPTGRALLLSDARRSRVGMEFGFPDYPSERVAFDGDNGIVTALPGAGRTHLGAFFLSYGGVASSGLLGGVLSEAWILRQAGWNGAKLELRNEIINLRDLIRTIDDDQMRVRRIRELNFRLMKLGEMRRKGPMNLDDLPQYEEKIFRKLTGE